MLNTKREGLKLAAPVYLARYTNDARHLAGSRNDRVEKSKESSAFRTRCDLILANLRRILGTTKDDGMHELVGRKKPAIQPEKCPTIPCDVT